MDSREAALIGRIGGYAKAARYSPDQLTKEARTSFLRRFEPDDPNLSEPEKQRRTQAALRAHMALLALRSATARRKRNGKSST